MIRDDRFYAFIVARTSRSRSHIRRICLHKRWLKVFAVLLLAVVCTLLYGLYGLTQQAQHLRIEQENQRLRTENERQRQELRNLNNRVDAVEDTSRRLAEISGLSHDQQVILHARGGPAFPVDSAGLAALDNKTSHLEQQMRKYEEALRERGMTPSLQPVDGRLESGFGGRGNPFGGSSFEFHTGQDIDAPWGAPVVAAATGRVIIAGWQHGYGQVVYIDHGSGLTTRYGHLSQIAVKVGQNILRGENLGRVGSTGRSTGPHLHYEVRINETPVDPLPYLTGVN
ncbi:MAG: peptidoglycan DD-metalloendopeptidase family protein [Pyrinomonadaceae bacterium]